MSAPEHVPTTPADAPRVGDHQRFPGQRRAIKRYADMATIPREPRFATPSPDAGYALLLAERFADRLELAATERADDALFAGSMLAMKRSGRAGRGPIPADLEVGLTILGYLGGAPDDMQAWRAHELASVRHDYHLQRRLADRVDDEVLALTAGELLGRLSDWRWMLHVAPAETAAEQLSDPARKATAARRLGIARRRRGDRSRDRVEAAAR